MLPTSIAPALYRLAGKRVLVAGQHGMVGSAVVRRLGRENCEVITVPRQAVDLRRQKETEDFFEVHRPQIVFLAAAKVGGIKANSERQAEFLYDNLMIATNTMEAARQTGIEKLVFFGSSCIYPKFAPQPIQEDALLTGPLEPTNEAYAVAKITGLKMAEKYRKQYGLDFISLQPTNLYGPGDNFDLDSSHVPAALLRRFHEAKEERRDSVTVWGTGNPRRDFLYVDDLADAAVFLAQHYSGPDSVNVGTGNDVSIADFASIVAKAVGYDGRIEFDETKPDGTPRKLLDVSRLTGLGWRASTALRSGLQQAYASYLSAIGKERPARPSLVLVR